jgi:AraC-type transcriptional regulator N-terminus
MPGVAKTRSAKSGHPSRLAALRAELIRKICAHIAVDGVEETNVPGLCLYRQSTPTICNSATYEPRLIVFVQGQKRIDLGSTAYICDESNFLLSAVDLPVLSQVTKATPQKPILGLMLKLEMPEVRRLLGAGEFPMPGEPADARGMAVGVSSIELLNACSRLLDLLDTPHDIPFLSRLIQQEMIYRLLRSPQGKHLRAIATLGEQSHRTAKAVSWLRIN